MAINVDKTLAALSKLYDKRAALDKSILTAQKALAAAASEAAKLPKPAAKKPATAKKAATKKASPKA
jgi:prefoldin subunit 5